MMHPFKLVCFLGLVMLSWSCTNSNSQNDLSPSAFSEKIKQMSTAPLVDVRTPEEFSKGHLPNAINIDWNGEQFDDQIAKLDKTKPVFVYCLSGGRSASAASQMRSSGFKEVYELHGGIMAWRGASLPESTDSKSMTLGMSKQQFEDLLKTEKTVLVDFYADWCAPCKKMKPYLDEISEEMATSVTVIRINADDNQELCKQLGINALPVLQVYKSEKITWKYEGFIAREEVVKQLR